MTMLPQLRESLVSAAGRLDAGAPAPGRPGSRVRSGLRSAGRGFVPLVAIVAALLIAVLAITSLRGVHRAARPLGAAATGRPVQALPTHVPNTRQGLISILAVLRRPQTASDLPKVVRQIVGTLASLNRPVDRSLARYAERTPWGQRLFILAFLPPTAAQLRRFEKRWRIAVRDPRAETVGLIAVTGRGAGGGGDADASQIERSGSLLCFGTVPAAAAKPSDRTLGRSECAGIVPDGVARVVFTAPPRSGHGVPGAVLESVTVEHNVIAYRSPRGHYLELWYSAAGGLLRRQSLDALPSSDA